MCIIKNKDALIDALRNVERTRLTITLKENLDPSKSTKKQLFDICKAYIEFAVQQPDSFQLLFSLPTGRESVDIVPEEDSPYLPLVKTCRKAIELGEVASYIDDAEYWLFNFGL